MKRRWLRGLWLTLLLLAGLPASAVHEETTPGEMENRPAPVSRRECVGGANVGQLCNEDADCPASTCIDRNVYNMTVSVRFNATAVQLTTIQNAMNDMATSLFDVTDGQAQIGQITILNNSSGSGGDIWVNPTGGLNADSGHWGAGGQIRAGIGRLGQAGAGEGMAHEFAHLVFDIRDEYESRAAGCGSLAGSAECPASGSGEEFCMMDVGGLNGGGTEFCWGQADPLDIADISGGNHDPNNVTEQSRCRSNRSCWDQMGHSWPETMLVPTGAPDPGNGGNVLDPIVFVVPPNNARIVLVLDRSGSMGSESPSRMERMQVAALDLVNLAQNGTELGIVSFASTATDEVAIAALGANRIAYVNAINGLTPSGATNIGDGLQHARDMIDAAGGVTGNTSIILMTDGVNNRPQPTPAVDLQNQIDALLMDGIPVYVTCTGGDSGLASQCSEIAAGTMGTYVDSADSANMQENFTEFHESALQRTPIFSQTGIIEGAPINYTVAVERDVQVATFTVQWRQSDTSANFTAISPSGMQFRGQPLERGRFFRVLAPEEGIWSVEIRPPQEFFVVDDYVTRVYAQSQRVGMAGVARVPDIEPGAEMVLFALPRFTCPIAGAQVSGIVMKPDGSVADITLLDEGRGPADTGDDVAGDGIYTQTFRDTAMPGAYSFELNVIVQNAFCAEQNNPQDEPIAEDVPNFRRQIRYTASVRPVQVVNGGLCIGSAAGPAGTQVEVPITLDDANGVAGFQVDVAFDPTILTPTSVSLGADTAAAGGWSVDQALVGAGVLRVLGSNSPPTGLPPGAAEVALVKFDIAASAPDGVTTFGLSDCVLSDELGLQLPCDLCDDPGGVTVREASSFSFEPIPDPVGVDRFDPLPFPVTIEAFDDNGNPATGYNGVADVDVLPPSLCEGTLAPNTATFVGGVAGPNDHAVECCIDPLLPSTTIQLLLEAEDPSIAVTGVSNPFRGVAKGDVDANNAVDVVDVLRAVRLALGQSVPTPPTTAFQSWAADMLNQLCAADGTVNVLDVVRIRNKALLRPPLCNCSAKAGAGARGPAPAPIRAELRADGSGNDVVIAVHDAADLAGVQVELSGVRSRSQVRLTRATRALGWQVFSKLEGTTMRILAFGDAAAIDGPVLRVTGAAGARIESIVTSDSAGRALQVR